MFYCLFIFDLFDFDNVDSADEDYEVNILVDSSASVSSCNNRELSYSEIENDVYKCCYLNAYCVMKNEYNENDKYNLKSCYPVTKEMYDSLGVIIEQAKSSGCQTYEIKCNSSYLGLTLIFLILFLL